jgi:hypothetical protein
MVECRSGPGLSFESPNSRSVRGKVGGEHLDGDRPLETGVFRFEDFAIPPAPMGERIS